MNKTDVIKTKSGKVQGYKDNGVQIFKGIPYAASPVGSLRFSPPAQREPWSEIFDATKYGPHCYQGYTPLEAMFGKPEWESETDCLNLNIWTPSTDDENRPVMVWIHGGAFIMGGGANPTYKGSVLAKHGDVVIVTINYRLGALGFLNTPGVIANVGMLDQIAALKWVHDNIRAFGGNPNNVSIFGESAGGISVITLMAMPEAKGLFHRVIAQSAPVLDPKPAKISTKNLFRELGLKKGDVEALRQVPPEKIIEAQNKVLARLDKEGRTELLNFRPCIDGNTLPVHPLEALNKGESKNIDLTIALLSRLGITQNQSMQIIETYKDVIKDISSADHLEVLDTIFTDYIFRIPGIRFAEAHLKHNPNTFNYLFTWPSPAFKGKLGSCHIMEIPFVFGTLDLPKADMFFGNGPEAEILNKNIMDAWTAFARTGNPNHDGNSEWPTYDVEKRSTMVLDREIKIIEAYCDKERAAWDGLLTA